MKLNPHLSRRSCLAALAVTAAIPRSWGQAAPSASADAAAAPRLPLETFARLPLLTHMSLSPDGGSVGAVLNDTDRSVLITRPIDGESAKMVLSTDNRKFLFNKVRWLNPERLAVSVMFPSRRDFVGTIETRLFSIKSDGSGVVNLVENRPDMSSVYREARAQQLQDEVVDWMTDDGQHILLDLPEPGRATPTLYRVDVNNGQRNGLKSPERDVRLWLSDAQHRVRIGIRESEGDFDIRACNPDGSGWRTLWSFKPGRDAVWPMGFGRDPQELYVRANYEGRTAVFTVRLDQPDLPRALKFAHARYDVEGTLLRSPATQEVVGLRLEGGDSGAAQARNEIWDPAWRDLMRSIDSRLPKRYNLLVNMSQDEKTFLVYSAGNGIPAEYYVGRTDKPTLSLIGETYPGLKPADLAGKRPVTIKARDGLNLNAFLTLPRGVHRGGAPLPFVLLPHGGPQSRDGLEFDPWTEFLANRGYAVLQVNFRGSQGYGSDFESAGLQRWGLEMQDDLTDAVGWALAQGIADPKRVAIVGGSYGGYATLMGLVKTPELFRCGISFAGVSDLLDLIREESAYVGGAAAIRRMIGDAWDDRQRLRATSPALLADRVQAPVLLVHGTADRVVPVQQSEDMAKALRKAGKTVRYIEQEDGDHWLSGNPQRVEFFRAMEEFLAENMT